MPDQLTAVVQKYWGYDSFRPLQREAMQCAVEGRDSVVVLPTGGGKSLCYQAPAMCTDGLAIVVSPLISLMKDQVDALTQCGVPAACVNSSMTIAEKRDVADRIRDRSLKLVYCAPERLVQQKTIDFFKTADVSLVAIDEAHCISEWGHDFRPEYRQLRMLKEVFPHVGVHAYTATATEPVRQDVARQLNLKEPEFLVGSFDRGNLLYRVLPRNDRMRQILDVLSRHEGESGIIYCTTRKDVDAIAGALNGLGQKALPYHAGMESYARKQNQDAFTEEKCDVVVATVAFGMGIDKSNVRFVIHAGMPKMLESYQQESGRAGRDGLEAECLLLYSPGDAIRWKGMLEEQTGEARAAAAASLAAMEQFSTGVACRHRALIEYFGQTLDDDNCGACDVCLGELDLVDDAKILGQKILSCVVRLNQRFGGDYTAMVLTGSKDQRILNQGHNELSTYGLLEDESKQTVRDWIEQLAVQGYLQKTGEYNVLQVSESGRRLLKGEETPKLLRPSDDAKTADRQTKVAADSWEGVDRDLFESLRTLRREKADERGVPAYVVFGDAALRDMARLRPSSLESFREVRGVGEKKQAEFGEEFVAHIAAYCSEHNLETDVEPPTVTAPPRVQSSGNLNATAIATFPHFQAGKSVEEVAGIMSRAASTTRKYLSDYLTHNKITDVSAWVDDATLERVRIAFEEVGDDRLTPIFEHLKGEVSYEELSVARDCLRNRRAGADASVVDGE